MNSGCARSSIIILGSNSICLMIVVAVLLEIPAVMASCLSFFNQTENSSCAKDVGVNTLHNKLKSMAGNKLKRILSSRRFCLNISKQR